eukprot:CAMPEP_0171695564 /NCGR_PEP_ID=MMETSP0991-20121206/7829_1 /TAXON_ID=483369 /ORGANISM="non described non described, Strain CCMP2098" /LENGTH=387 /DNA_ID=CAMNT_0012284247 /DNA_START=237 /DNA_END=1400 /DNA_ORIENTATION=+
MKPGGWQQLVNGVHSKDSGHGWRWLIPGECSLVDFSPKFFCETLHSLYAANKLKFGIETSFGEQSDPLPSGVEITGHHKKKSKPTIQATRSSGLINPIDQPTHFDTHKDARGMHRGSGDLGDVGLAIPPPGCDVLTDRYCHLHQFSGDLWHGRPILTFVGDSIVGGQLQALLLSPAQLRTAVDPGNSFKSFCGVSIHSFRSDRLSVIDKPRDPVLWVEAVCRSTVAVVNSGAHANGLKGFTSALLAGAQALERRCGEGIRKGRPLVMFRTTPEGNPWCNSKENPHLSDMNEWSKETWRIISGEVLPPDPEMFKLQWHWQLFQAYNEAAAKILRPLGVKMLDVVPMTRLRPSYDWNTRPGKKLDCLHGNLAVHEWNTLLVNAIAADLC